MLVALLVVASMFIGVCYHAYSTYAEIHTGRKTWGPVRPHGRHRRRAARDRHLAAHRSHRHPVSEVGMSEQQHVRADGTVTFLPHRLNRHPRCRARPHRRRAVDLLRLVRRRRPAGRRAVVLDVPHDQRWRRRSLLLGVALGVFIGGGILRRLKRGRPDTWLYRQLQWRIATRHPLMAGWVGSHVLISRSGFWTTRRSASRVRDEPLQERDRLTCRRTSRRFARVPARWSSSPS